MVEVWKDIKGFEHYEVSSIGNVRSKERTSYFINNGKPINRLVKSFILKPSIACGYKRVALYKNNVPFEYKIHRLVAETFISNPENKEQVNHIDGNKTNNHVSNLEWVTRSENTIHAVKNGLAAMKFDKFDILHMKALRQSGVKVKEIAKIFNGSVSYVGEILNNHVFR